MNVNRFMEHIPWRGLCLQAGGAAGKYPRALADYFAQVVTYEPDQENWPHLLKCCAGVANITAVRKGFWNCDRSVSLSCFRPNKHNTTFVAGDGNDAELIMIDSLGLKPDLIWLDIEGSEYFALLGASSTLKDCKAVIIEEATKGHEGRVGCKPGDARELLNAAGFSEKFNHRYDHLFVKNDAQN
jgi:FkbM family methyltransferase